MADQTNEHDPEATIASAGEPVESATVRLSTGRYVPLTRVGLGAFGSVYAAIDPRLDRKVAVKVLRPERQNAHNRARLLREAKALAAVSHPNVVGIYDVSESDDQRGVHIAMEFVEGRSFRDWVRAGRSRAEILAALSAIGRGLAASHAAGLAHRDIKPDNVMVTFDGVPKIVDFGLARAGASDSVATPEGAPTSTSIEKEITNAGTVMGTPAYMAPEQHAGERGGPMSDQFSFCVLAYEALVGYRPFAGDSPSELQINIRAGRVRTPPRSAIPTRLWRVLQRGLAADPYDRFGSMLCLLDALERRTSPRTKMALRALAIVTAFAGGLAVQFGPRGGGDEGTETVHVGAACSAMHDAWPDAGSTDG
jgi:serine/threonine protein kinase